jgi:hypothetical protein
VAVAAKGPVIPDLLDSWPSVVLNKLFIVFSQAEMGKYQNNLFIVVHYLIHMIIISINLSKRFSILVKIIDRN